jgi:hypothetical protein
VELLETGPTEVDANDGVVVDGNVEDEKAGGVKALLLSCFNPTESWPSGRAFGKVLMVVAR